MNVKSRAALHRSKEEDRDKGPSITRLRQRRNLSEALHRSKEEDRDKGPSVTRLRQRRNLSGTDETSDDDNDDIIRGNNRHGTLRGRQQRTLSMPPSSLIHYPANVQSKEELNLNTLLVEHKEHP